MVGDKQNYVKCYHCGDPCSQEHHVLEGKGFCCNGCKTVYQILNENDLCTYYDLEQSPGISLKSKKFDDKYAYLDNEEIQDILLNFKSDKLNKILFYIPSIHCSSCIWLLENIYRLCDGIEYSRVNFARKEVAIDYNPQEISLRKIVEQLTTIGYEPHISLEDQGRKRIKSVNRSLIIKIGVAGFAFGNIMLLSFPEYFGFEGIRDKSIQLFISYLNIVLALPVFFYCASDYYTSAISGLRQKYFNVDVPISLGILALFGRSIYEIVWQVGPGYLDSLAGLLFFLLVGRWFQSKTYEGLSFERDYKSYFPLAVIRYNAERQETVPVRLLEPQDKIMVRNMEIIPSDSILLSEHANIDYSFVTGESEPVRRKKGEQIYAGGRQIGESIMLEVVKPVSQSYLTQLWNNEVFSKPKESRLEKMVDKVSRYFTAIIIAIALGGLLYWLQYDTGLALNVFTAVLIVACPCALSLSTPFTMGNTMRVFGKVGFYLKNASVIEIIPALRHIVFDKTGTLTINNDHKAVYQGESMDQKEMAALAAVTANSTHPVSRKIKMFTAVEADPLQVTEFEEFIGEGIKGIYNGLQIRVGKASWLGLNGNDHAALISKTYIEIGGKLKGALTFDNTYRPFIKPVMQQLATHYHLSLVTGDNDSEASNLKSIFPNTATIKFQQQPEEKLEYIKEMQQAGTKVMMIGDGLNDAGALQQSDVGISITDDISQFTPASDAILKASTLKHLPQLLKFGKTAKWIVIISFIISFLYNIVGLAFAITGILTPLFAAVLMPLSSISVVAFATIAVNLSARIKGIL